MLSCSAVVSTHRVCLLICSAVMIVTACSACTISTRDTSKDNASAPVAAPVPVAPVVVAPVAVAPLVAAPAVTAPRPVPATAAPARARRRSGETCGHSPDNCETGFFCSTVAGSTCQPFSVNHVPGTRIGDSCSSFRDCHGPLACNPSSHKCQSFDLAAGRLCSVDLACASRVCVKPRATSTFGNCR